MHHWDELREASHSLDDSPSNSHENLKKRLSDIYDLPYISKYLAKFRIFSMIPLCPSYKGFMNSSLGCCENVKSNKKSRVCSVLKGFCNVNEEEIEGQTVEDILVLQEPRTSNIKDVSTTVL